MPLLSTAAVWRCASLAGEHASRGICVCPCQDMAPNVPNQRKFVNPKNKQTKVTIVFDEKARKEYLTGFRKRKAERKKRFAEKLKKDIKAERKRVQAELRDNLGKSTSSRPIPEVEHLVKEDEACVYELSTHTVTVEPISDSKYKEGNLYLGNNQSTEQEEDEQLTLAEKKKQLKELNRKSMKMLQKTKVMKRHVKIHRGKSKKRAKKTSKTKK